MRRALAAAATAAVVALALSGCGGSDGGAATSSGDETAAGTTSSAATSTPSDEASPTTEETAESDTPSEAGTEANDTSTPAGGGKLDACAVVTKDLLNTDLGLALTADGTTEASSYGDSNASDCYYFDQTTIVVQASTRADQDTPASSFDAGALPGAKPIPGSDRGYAYVLTSSADSSVGTVFVVKGQESLNLAVSVTGPLTVDQLLKVGTDTLAAM